MDTPLPASGDLDDLIACPNCDALYTVATPPQGGRAVCGRCHTVLISPRKKAGMMIIALALTLLILVMGAAVFPFLDIRVQGLQNSASILDTMLAFRDGRLILLALATAALILFIPALRAMLILYVLLPVVFDRPPYRHASRAFQISERLRPWSMAEIFAIGCAVSLVKIAGMAHVGFGAAFWMFAALVIIVILQDRTLCKWSVWTSLKHTTS